MNAQPRRALDAWPWPPKKPLYPVIIEKGAAGKTKKHARLHGGRFSGTRDGMGFSKPLKYPVLLYFI